MTTTVQADTVQMQDSFNQAADSAQVSMNQVTVVHSRRRKRLRLPAAALAKMLCR